MHENTRLLTIDEAADILRCSRVTIYARVREGKFSIRKMGNKSFILKPELDAFIDNLPKALISLG